jgi:ADP-ribosyl-[dinitrogen reductase] hydrolase
MNTLFEYKRGGLFWGPFIADALAMPVHWYYDRAALRRDYGLVREYQAPRNPHADSILWRSEYVPLSERGNILHDQAQFWGKRGIHYHQFLHAGENTLNLQLAQVLMESLIACGGYDGDDYLRRYVEFMLTPGRHTDTYVEEYHRKFFTNYARGTAPRKCAGNDIHIGGLAHVGVLSTFFADEPEIGRSAVQGHINLTHRSSEVLTAADATTQIVAAVLRGSGLREAIFEHGSDWLSKRKAEQWSREPDEVVIGRRVSPACYIADAFPASLYLAWKYADDFEAGVVANANVGGDNCHRGAVLGAMLGAAAGWDRIPSRFVNGLHAITALRPLVENVSAGRRVSVRAAGSPDQYGEVPPEPPVSAARYD